MKMQIQCYYSISPDMLYGNKFPIVLVMESPTQSNPTTNVYELEVSQLNVVE